MGVDDNKRGKRLVVAISGASGISLALYLLRAAAAAAQVEKIHLVVSTNALRVATTELDPSVSTPAAIVSRCDLSPEQSVKIVHHSNGDIAASIASGSYPTDGMVVIPCSSGTLASIAHGISRGLIQRAADLTLKERRRLVLALRETPFSLIHAENIVQVTRAGAVVMPPIPAFYAGETWEVYHQHFAMRILDLFGIELSEPELRWSGPRRAPSTSLPETDSGSRA